MNFLRKKREEGFTLVELMLVIAIFGMLISALLGYMEDSRDAARDSNRKQQLRSMQTVLEFYRNETGSYPVAMGGLYSCDNPTDYIPNLVADGYSSILPVETARCGGGSIDGYYYTSNGSEYKIYYYNPADIPVAGETFYDGNRNDPNGVKAIALCSHEDVCLDETNYSGL